ncbi:MAG: hypothetical protein QXY18_00185 [Nitrososphaerota archaeon]
MEEIIKKIEKTKDKELALKFFNELTTSLRHIENIIIALPTIFTTLFALLKMLEIKIDLAIEFFGFLGFLALIKNGYNHLKTKKLLKELINILSEDPSMNKEDIKILIEELPLILYGIGMIILGLIIYFS